MNEIKYLVMSDLHLGHKTNDIDNMCKNINIFLNTNMSLIKDIKILFIAGDIFDSYIPSYTNTYLKITKLLISIVQWCQEYNIKLRVLEGTPSHDWKQASVISTIIKDFNINIDYKYIDKIEIEKIQDLGVNVLYVPDQIKPKGNDVYKDVLKTLKENNLDKIDISIMHGQFHYQFPRLKLDSSHNEEDYLNITKHYIHIGHIHSHSVKDRIIAQGSFDRIAHGEEEPKGCILAKINKNDNSKDEYIFLENKTAMKFVTKDYRNLTEEEFIKNINILVKSLLKGSNIRLSINKEQKDIINSKSFKNIINNYNFKILYQEDNIIKLEDKIMEEKIIDSFTINKDNILDLVSKELYYLNIKEDGHLELLKKYI